MTIPLCSPSVIGSISQAAVIEALGWALVHFVWQGTAIALALAGFLAFARRLSAQARYAAGCAALSLMALGACSTFVWQVARAQPQPAPETAVTTPIDSLQPSTGPRPIVLEARDGRMAATPRDAVAITRPQNEDKLTGRGVETAGESRPSPIAGSDSRTMLLAGWADRLRPGLPWLVALWGVGVALLSLRLAHGWRTIRRLRTSAAGLVDPVWMERFALLRERLGMSYSVRLLSSAGATVPMVIGSFKPVVLVPAGLLTGLSAAQVEALLVHELAHIRRHDYIANLLQNMLETLFFYHPAVWWVSGQIRKEREHCCDDVAAAACGTLGYAQALASLAELRQAAPGFGLAANSAPLLGRIGRLAGVDPSSHRTAGWLAIAALVALVTAISLRPAARTHADGQDTKTVKGAVIDAHGRPVADAEVIAESQHHRCGSAQTNGHGEFQMQVPAKIAIEAYRVSLPHVFDVSLTLDKRAPLALSFHRFVAAATVEKQDPLVLKVEWNFLWPPSERKTSPQTTSSGKTVRKIAGRVVDHEGKPIADSHVWWMVFDHGFRKPTVLAACACDSAGRFRMEIPSDGKPLATRPNDELWALAPGKQSTAVGETEKLQVTDGPATSEMLSEVVIHLDPAPDFSFQVNDAAGRPVSGATLERLWCGQHFPGALLGELPAEPEWPTPFRECDRATTGATGVAHLSANSDQMRIAAPEWGTQTIHDPILWTQVFPIGGKARHRVPKKLIVLRPVGRVEGRVVADDPRLVRGRKLRLSTFWEAGKCMVEGSAVVTTDSDGNFVVPAIAEGYLRFKFLDTLADPSLIPIAKAVDVQAHEAARLEIRLRPAGLVEGVIQAQETGEAVPGAELFLGGGFQQGEKVTSDGQGRYHARFPAGQVSLQAIRLPDDHHADYQQWFIGMRLGRTVPSSMHSPSLWKVTLKATVDGKPFEVPAIVRVPSKMLEGKVIDGHGRPLVNARVKAEDGLGRYDGTTDDRGEFEMQVPKAAKFESFDVSLWPGRLVTDVRIEKQEPLVLKVDAISAMGGDEFSHRKKGSN